MLKISNMKIIYKIVTCFVLLSLVVGGAIWFATAQMKAIDHRYSALIENEVKALADGLRVNQRTLNFARIYWRLIAETDQEEMKKMAADMAVNQKEMDQFFDAAKKHAPKFAERYDQAHKLAKEIFILYQPLEKAALANNNAEALQIAKSLLPKATTLRRQISEINAEMQKEMDAKSDQASVDTAQTVTITVASISGALALVLALAFIIVQFGVARPIGGLVGELKKLAAGDFNVTLPWLGRKDEIGQIAEAVEMVADKVGSTIGNIKMAANEVTNASAEISTSTTDLSQRTEEQAASLEETSASMEQISSTVKKNAENARQANDFATETNTVAERGGAVVGQAVTAMARIEESSRKISDIIGVIDEIARQTNLLALNAAVEAARAGEAGRGFAVVASEVRSLAQRSSQAAKDIKDLITNSNSQVKDGVDLVNKAGESLNEIVASIKKVAVIVADISNASMEQSTGIEQVNKALTQMDEVTQQNSALVEENAATAKTLEHQAKSMDERVASFRLRNDAGRGEGGESARPSETGEQKVAVARVAAAPPSRGPAAPKQKPVAQLKQVASGGNGGGPVRRMQAELATAVKSEPDWKEF